MLRAPESGLCCVGNLASDAALASKLEGSSPPDDGSHAIARLAWGLLLAQFGPDSAAGKTPAEDFAAVLHGGNLQSSI